MRVIDAARLEKRREKAVKARGTEDRHVYFCGVAEARYVLRKVYRLVEDEAKRAGLDPLAHQALIQIYGSDEQMLRVKEVAERLDITAAFASSLVKMLDGKNYVARSRDKHDNRVIWVKITKSGRDLLHRIDEQVQIHVDYFTRGLTPHQTEAALSILMFYAGASLRQAPKRAGRGE
ncbi:MAG: MarR family transcriptional regulator [Alphaproteobacteria bacterium]|nr:MarR family transcriptional regulator [Alphaproteobacteria bacterium]